MCMHVWMYIYIYISILQFIYAYIITYIRVYIDKCTNVNMYITSTAAHLYIAYI